LARKGSASFFWAAKISRNQKLPMADSIIAATALMFDAIIWTMDDHF